MIQQRNHLWNLTASQTLSDLGKQGNSVFLGGSRTFQKGPSVTALHSLRICCIKFEHLRPPPLSSSTLHARQATLTHCRARHLKTRATQQGREPHSAPPTPHSCHCQTSRRGRALPRSSNHESWLLGRRSYGPPNITKRKAQPWKNLVNNLRSLGARARK